MKFRIPLLSILAFAALPLGAGAQVGAETIYTGGPVLTMNDAMPRAEAVAIRAGRILAVGSRDALLQKSKKDVYNDPVVKYGYARGMEPVLYVSRILDRFEHYREFVTDEGPESTIPGPVEPADAPSG